MKSDSDFLLFLETAAVLLRSVMQQGNLLNDIITMYNMIVFIEPVLKHPELQTS